MIAYDDALQALLANVPPLPAERIAAVDGSGRYLAEPVTAALDAPRADVSTMDGYAVRDGDLATQAELTVIGEASAGTPFAGEVGPGEAVRIFTGAQVPRGADRVVMQEDCRRDGARIGVADSCGPERNVRRRGSDFGAGDTVLARGARLSPAALVALSGADRSEVAVARCPVLSVIATGDELAEPGRAAQSAHAVPDSASSGVCALALRHGARLAGRFRGRDRLDDLEELARQAFDCADIVVVIGGASVGDHDLAQPMFRQFALSPVFAKVAIKPGKPVWFARGPGKYVLGLPGNPGSAMVTARLFLVPLLAALQGGDGLAAVACAKMVLAGTLPVSGMRETFVRARLAANGLEPVANQDSGAQAPLAHSDWLIRRPPGDAAKVAGEFVAAIPF